ncbi:thioesterase family protein [Phenylobacterium sp. Root700]|uniref:thioesterase family protein n=1 Tax=Phenylobacterium sp. Root700 TaxID=1736591 RepID=UPI000701FF73|nr:thioesterase family protein [Phenylobacterium sp. Root700]KRB40942.1 acyl-CoA thioesterase [Phenylobacterium sp. Root700]
MSQQNFASLMSTIEESAGSFSVTLPDDWLQGRTAFGGLSAALCWEAAQRVGDLPPLRSAQFAFVGPAGGRLRIEPTLLRRGKSAAFYSVDLFGDDALAVRGLLTFGASRASKLDQVNLPAPAVPGWDDCPTFFQPNDRRSFLQHFDSRFAAGARPFTAGGEPEMIVWLKHRGTAESLSLGPLIALADALPPAAIVNFEVGGGPISTMTWSIEVLSEAPHSASGWWLVRTTAQTAVNGYSAQDMTVWDDVGSPVMAMRQTVAIFT